MLVNLFYEEDLSGYLARSIEAANKYIHSQTAEYLLNVDEEDFVAHLVESFPAPSLDIRFDEPAITTSEKQIHAREHPSSFSRDRNWSAARQVITYHLPFDGDARVLRCQPNPHVMSSVDVRVDERAGEICLEVVDFHSDAERLRQTIDSQVNTIRTQFSHVQANLDAHAAALPETLRQSFLSRKQELKKRADTVSLLGIPVKARDGFSDTFSVPVTRRKVFDRPVAASKKPEQSPALSEKVYEGILKVLWDMGRAMERLPSTYSDKDEESLRDHFIMNLEPQFEGNTTGETFNKSGKTDILIRWEKETVFIAECKFWTGRKGYLATIDQLLGYLTWRDSKAAVVMFVRNKDISPVLAEIEEATPTHANFVALEEQREESWRRYKFHINGDADRHFALTVLVFHLPE